MTPEEFIRRMRSGTFDLEEIGRGMHKSFRNAESLLADAEHFLDRRPGRAMSFAVLAAEEIAKVFLLTEAAPMAAVNPVPWDEIEKTFRLRAHHAKLQVFSLYGDRLLNVFAKKATPYYEKELPVGMVPLLDYFKQLGLYVNPTEGRFVSPEEFGQGNPELAAFLVSAVKERLESIRGMHCSEERSIEMARCAAEIVKIARSTGKEGDPDPDPALGDARQD